MNTSTWLAEIEVLPHSSRVQRAVELGRAAREGDAAARAMVRELAQASGAYERQWALFSCFGSKDGALVLRMTSDGSRTVRALAARLVPHACDDEQALAALRIARERARARPMVAALAARHRSAAVDRFLTEVAASGDDAFADLAPYGSLAFVLAHRAQATSRPSTAFWSRLAKRHPAALAVVLEERVRAQKTEADDVTRLLLRTYGTTLAREAPDPTLSLLDAMYERRFSVDPSVLTALTARRPEATHALLGKHGLARLLTVSATRSALEAMSDEAFAALARESPATIQSTDPWWFVRASEARRRAVAAVWIEDPSKMIAWGRFAFALLPDSHARDDAFALWSVAMRDPSGAIALTELERLPDALAEREARRHLFALSALHTRPAVRAQYARFLPWNEAREACASLLAHPEGEQRSVALSILLQSAGRRVDSTSLEDAVALVLARRFEQDPVRRVMLATLGAWPAARLAQVPLDAIGTMVRHALDASDTSDASASSAERIVLRSFARDPQWGATWVATLLRERGRLYDYLLGRHLSDQDVRACAPTLLAVASEWAARERSAPFVQLAQSLEGRITLVPGLSELLLDHGLRSAWPEVSMACARILIERDRAQIEPRLGELFSGWVSRGWTSVVLGFAASIQGHRAIAWPAALSDALEQVLLRSPFLAEVERAFTAIRLGDPRCLAQRLAPWIERDPSVLASGAVRMHLHRQRQELLAPFIAGRAIHGRFAKESRDWVLLFDHGFKRWTPAMQRDYAASLDRVLADDKRDTPTLLACVSRLPLLAWTPGAELMARTLDPRAALQEKAVRVLARCDAGQGLDTLIECLGDGRARFAVYALGRAFAEIPDAQALAVLSRAPMNKVTIAKEVLRLLGALRAPEAYARLLEVDRQPSLHRDVRIALLRALWGHLSRPESWAIYERAVREGDWVTASRVGDVPPQYLTLEMDRKLSALLASVLDRPDVEARIELLQRAQQILVRDDDRVLLRAITARLSSPYVDESRAATGALILRARATDHAHVARALVALSVDRRAFGEAMGGLLSQPLRLTPTASGLAWAVLEALSTDPRHGVLCARLAARSMDAQRWASWIEARAAQGALHADALYACRDGVSQVHLWELGALVDRLASSPHAAARRVAVWGLERDAGPMRGWTLPRLKLLRALRDDRDPMVSAAACDLFPPRELDPG